MSTKKKQPNPHGFSPSELALAEFHALKAAQSKGGRNRWKGSTAKQRSAAMRAVALAKAAKP